LVEVRRNLSKLPMALLVVVILFSSFLAAFLVIFLTQFAHSIPSTSALAAGDGMYIEVGPPPNSENVSLDTLIIVDALTSASLSDLRLTPEVPIDLVTSEVSGPLSYERRFYPAQLLEPSTSYNVSVTILTTPISWSFTTAKVFVPGIGFYLTTNIVWVSLSVACLATIIIVLVIIKFPNRIKRWLYVTQKK
jgi:hypothetical protein